ncbi:hypothetical protein BaRGS_00038877 [Batillaria attramentaria]|uniref:Uncharacterized protein n=1 Tax=Batillaria attramentaria TaxID=370345 RepID=A0ABD0J4H5_9CAEN
MRENDGKKCVPQHQSTYTYWNKELNPGLYYPTAKTAIPTRQQRRPLRHHITLRHQNTLSHPGPSRSYPPRPAE